MRLQDYEKKGCIMDDQGLHILYGEPTLPPQPPPIVVVELPETKPNKPKIEESIKEIAGNDVISAVKIIESFLKQHPEITKVQPPQFITAQEARASIAAFDKLHPEASQERREQLVNAVMGHVDPAHLKLLSAAKLLSEKRRLN